jgi:hypothetical protein
MLTKSSLPILSTLATVTFLPPLHLRAQEAAPAAPGEIQQMDRFEVKGVPIGLSTNPLTREVGSVLGDDRNLLETPRGVSTLTTALFNERQIHGVRDILVYSPSAYAGSSYGKTTVPNLRGDTAETYLNGQRLSYNLYGYFPSFNGVEAVDLVRGPGSAVYGAGYFTGGYVNYVSKRPSFGATSTTVTARFGTWAPGQTSYLNSSVQIDTTAPVSDTLAWRFSYEGLEDQTFWRKNGGRDDRQDLYGALTWRATPTTTVDLNAQFMWQSAPETLGVNRVNQDLIDHALYYTGSSADLYPTPGGIPATTAVKLPWDATLFSNGDYSNANIWRVQGAITTTLSDTLRLVNRELYEHVDRRRYNAFEYIEYVTQDTAEHRTELHADWTLFGQAQKTITGGTVRYEGRESYTNYFNEYFYNFDITQGNVFSEVNQYPSSYWPGQPGPGGHLFFSSSYDSPETVRSETWNPALFFQQDLALTRQLSAVVGYRFDDFWARARDPLPPEGGPYFRDAEEVSTHSQSYSLVYRPLQNLSFYATHNRIHAANGNVTGGGVILNTPDGQINRDDFRNLSELWELGVKSALLDNKLYLAGDWFQQTRVRVGLGGEKNNILVRGIELEASYQPISRLSFTANATFQDGHYLQSSPYQMGGRSIYDAYALGRGPGGKGTDTGNFDPWGNQVPVGDWPLLGFSNTMLNGSVRYQLPCGLGAGFNAQWQSPQKGNLDNEWHIPSQVLLNANLFYERGRWLYNLDFLNLSNERNWIHNGDAYTASQLISAELPFRLEGYVKYRF